MRNEISYVKVSIDVSDLLPYESDSLAYWLAEAGFEAFEERDRFMDAYVKKTVFDPESLKALLENKAYSVEELEDKDWNEEWEKNYFNPIVVAGRCVIHSSFHNDLPVAEYDILIDPKMSFGTGHHQTTRCMMEYLLEDGFAGKSVMDMGCGTGVLGILAYMRGASEVSGIDVDPHCIRNAEENIRLNNAEMTVLQGDAMSLSGKSFDVILANINRNILLADMDKYASALRPGGSLIMSGFYSADLSAIRQKAEDCGLFFVSDKKENDWTAAKFAKPLR